MPNYDYANSAGLTALSERTFEKIKKEITTDIITSEAANPLVIETAAAQYAKKTHLTLEPVQDLHGYDHPWPAGGGKNLLDYGNVHSSNIGVTATYNLYTGEYKVNFATGGQHQAVLSIANASSLAGKTVTFSYDSVSVSNSSRLSDWRIFLLTYVNGTNETIIANINSGTTKSVTVSIDSSITEIRVLFRMSQAHTSEIQSGDYVIWNKAQLELGSTATSYEPYSNICPITPMGHRNLLPLKVDDIKAANTVGSWSGNVYTVNGVSFTILTGSGGNVIGIGVNGTSNARIDFTVYQGYITAGNCLLNGYILLGNSGLYFTQEGVSRTYDYGSDANGVNITIADGSTTYVRIGINSGVTADNIIVKPMIRPASDPDSTFVPYGMARIGSKVTGKNLLKNNSTGGTTNGITFTVNDDGTVTANGIATDNAQIYINQVIGALPNGRYILSGFPSNLQTGGNNYIRLLCNNNTAILANLSSDTEVEFTVDDGHVFSRCFISVARRVTANNVVFKPMIRLASDTDDTYEPYTESVSSLDLQEPVYGGTLDLETGELVCTFKKIPNLGAYAWAKDGNAGKFFLQNTFTDVKLPPNNTTKANMICSVYAVNTNEETYALVNDKTISLASVSYYYFRIYDSRYASADAATFKTAMSGVQLCYELATPQTYQLTPQQLALFKGINNISANAKTVQVTYRNGELATTGNIVDAVEVAKQNAIGESASYTDAKLATELAPVAAELTSQESAISALDSKLANSLIAQYNTGASNTKLVITLNGQSPIDGIITVYSANNVSVYGIHAYSMDGTSLVAETTVVNQSDGSSVAVTTSGTSIIIPLATYRTGLICLTHYSGHAPSIGYAS